MISSRRDLIRTTGVMLGSVSAQFDYGRTAGLGATDRNVPVLFRVGVMFQRLRRATGSSEVTVNWCPWTCQFYLARLCLLVSFDVVTGSGQMQSGASVDDEVFVFLGPSVTDKCDDPRVLHVVCISHVRPVFCQTVSVSIGRQTLLLDGLSIFRSDCSPAVLVTFDAVVAGSNPVRHVGGILTRKC
jgi:hypothetical protein